MLHDFELAGRRVRAWQRPGESYEHVLMKALGYAMYVAEFPALEIEVEVGLRYKPDLVARGDAAGGGRFQFWGECGSVTVRKIAWLLKHGDVERLVVFKINYSVVALASELRAAIEERYRAPGRLLLVNFVADIAARTIHRRIARVPQSWYTTIVV
ncbi:MAG TPA: hypothetical protein VM943_11610 [Pyrinomonadaceae bacterium]|nr:hypothetical protein [Pyrinomonadaceae bacterium]